MVRTEAPRTLLAAHVQEILTNRKTSIASLAETAGVDRTVFYRVAVSEISNPSLNLAAKILISFGKEKAYQTLIDAASDNSLQSDTVFSEDDFIAEGNFGQQLRAYRIRRNLTEKKDIEAFPGLVWDDVIRFERNARTPRFLNLARMVHAYGINPNQAFHLLETAVKAQP